MTRARLQKRCRPPRGNSLYLTLNPEPEHTEPKMKLNFSLDTEKNEIVAYLDQAGYQRLGQTTATSEHYGLFRSILCRTPDTDVEKAFASRAREEITRAKVVMETKSTPLPLPSKSTPAKSIPVVASEKGELETSIAADRVREDVAKYFAVEDGACD